MKYTLGTKQKKQKTLLESQIDVDNAFKEKIIVKDDSFRCMNCPEFATIHRLDARSHALVCGTGKKSGRKSKKYLCPECGQAMLGKKALKDHMEVSHTLASYLCSVCLKRFKGRVTYKNHLQRHCREANIPCPYCDKKFTIASYRNKHVKRAHKNLPSISKSKETIDDRGNNSTDLVEGALNAVRESYPSDNVEKLTDVVRDSPVLIKVELQEEVIGSLLYWELRYTFSVDDRVRSRSYEQFYSSADVNCKEDWDAWINMSKALSLPVSSVDHDRFETALETNALGEVTVFCAGSTFLTDQEIFEHKMKNVESLINDLSLESPLETVSTGSDNGSPTIQATEEVRSDGDSRTGALSAPNAIKDRVLTKTYECMFCDANGFKDKFNLNRHVTRLHMGPVKCSVCENIFKDKKKQAELSWAKLSQH